MARILLLLALGFGLFLALRWLSRQPPRVYWQWIAALFAAGVLTLVLTGRAHWLAAVFAAMLLLVRGLVTLLGQMPLLKRMLSGVDALKSKPEPRIFSPIKPNASACLIARVTFSTASGYSCRT